MGDGGLAVRAGDPDDGEGGARISPEVRRHRPERRPDVGGDDLGELDVELVIDQQGDRTRRSRGSGQIVAVAPATTDAAEQRTRFDPERVLHHIGHVGVAVGSGEPEVDTGHSGHQATETHRLSLVREQRHHR